MYQNRNQGLPYNPPFVVPIVTTPELQQMSPFITGITMLEIESNAGKNATRAFFSDTCQRDQNFFGMIVQMVADLTDMSIADMHGRRGIDPESIAAEAAKNICAMQTSLLAFQNQNAFPNLSPSLVNDIQKNVQNWQNLEQELLRYTTYRDQQLRGWNNQQSGWGGGNQSIATRNSGGGWGSQTSTGFGGGGSNFGGGGSNHLSLGVSGNASLPTTPGNPYSMAIGNQDTGRGSSYGSAIASKANPSLGQAREVSFEGDKVTFDFNKRNLDSTPDNKENNGMNIGSKFPEMNWGQRNVVETPKPTYGSETKREWDNVSIEGFEVRPAYQAPEWKLSFNAKRPYRLCYDPAKHLLFKARDLNGQIGEFLKEWNPSMDYMRHELNDDLRKRAREEQQRDTSKIWTQISGLRQLPEFPLAVAEPEDVLNEESRKELLEPGTLATYDDLIYVRDLSDVEEVLLAELGSTQYFRFANKPFEVYVDLCDHHIVPMGTTMHVRSLAGQATLGTLAKSLGDMREKLGEKLFGVIDKRLAAEVSFIMTNRLGLTGWSIDSFMDDMLDLEQLIKDRYDEDLWLTLMGQARKVIDGALSVMTEEEVAVYATSESLREIQEEDEYLVFIARSSITYVPYRQDELAMTINEGGLIREDLYPKTHEALKSIIDRTNTESKHPTVRRYLMTSEGKLHCLTRGLLGNDDSLLLYPVK